MTAAGRLPIVRAKRTESSPSELLYEFLIAAMFCKLCMYSLYISDPDVASR